MINLDLTENELDILILSLNKLISSLPVDETKNAWRANYKIVFLQILIRENFLKKTGSQCDLSHGKMAF